MPQASAAASGPRRTGLLDVGDGHRIHWQEWGSATGKPAVVLHGGPGSGCSPRPLRFFDLTKYRVILFDQRGCGRSLPSASSDTAALRANTTQHLLADIELLREHIGVARWLVLGGSWGSTLGLAYGEQHPQSVSELVLFSVVTTTRREVQWVTRDVGRLFPAEWQRFRDGVPPHAREGNLAEAYNELLLDADPSVSERAAQDWCAWEDRHVRTHAASRPDPRYQDPSFRLCFARLVTHYWRHAAWLEEGSLLRDAGRLVGIPGALIHGALDFSSPLDIAWQLAQVWTDCELVVVSDEGHDGGASMTESISSATQRYAQ